MKNSIAVIEAEFDYAIRMVRTGYATPEQAAHVCGLRLSDLNERLARDAQSKPDGRGYSMKYLH